MMHKFNQRLACILVSLCIAASLIAPVAQASSPMRRNGWLYAYYSIDGQSASSCTTFSAGTTVQNMLTSYSFKSPFQNLNLADHTALYVVDIEAIEDTVIESAIARFYGSLDAYLPLVYYSAINNYNRYNSDQITTPTGWSEMDHNGVLNWYNESKDTLSTEMTPDQWAYVQSYVQHQMDWTMMSAIVDYPSEYAQYMQTAAPADTADVNKHYIVVLPKDTSASTGNQSGSSGGSGGAIVAVAGIGAAVIGGGILAATLFPASAIGQAVLQLGESLHLVPEGTAAQKLAEAGVAANEAAKPLAVQQSTAQAVDPTQPVDIQVEEEKDPARLKELQENIRQYLPGPEPGVQVINVDIQSQLVPTPTVQITVPLNKHLIREVSVYYIQDDNTLTPLTQGGITNGSYQLAEDHLTLYTNVSGIYVAVYY